MHGQVAVAELLLTLDANLLNRHDISHMTAIDYAVQVSVTQGRLSQCWRLGLDAGCLGTSLLECHDFPPSDILDHLVVVSN